MITRLVSALRLSSRYIGGAYHDVQGTLGKTTMSTSGVAVSYVMWLWLSNTPTTWPAPENCTIFASPLIEI